jgi:hypothetical protein
MLRGLGVARDSSYWVGVWTRVRRRMRGGEGQGPACLSEGCGTWRGSHGAPRSAHITL